jgi:hypothetical protein
MYLSLIPDFPHGNGVCFISPPLFQTLSISSIAICSTSLTKSKNILFSPVPLNFSNLIIDSSLTNGSYSLLLVVVLVVVEVLVLLEQVGLVVRVAQVGLAVRVVHLELRGLMVQAVFLVLQDQVERQEQAVLLVLQAHLGRVE